MRTPMGKEAQQFIPWHMQGGLLTNCSLAHLNVPKKMSKWGFKSKLWKSRKLGTTTWYPKNTRLTTISTYHINHINNTRSMAPFWLKKKKRLPITISKSKWTNQQLEDAMDIIESGHTSLRKANKYENIIFASLLDHLNGRTRSRKVGPQGVLTELQDGTIISWVLKIQKVGLFVTL